MVWRRPPSKIKRSTLGPVSPCQLRSVSASQLANSSESKALDSVSIMFSSKSLSKQQLPAPHHRTKRTHDPLTLKMKIVKSDQNWAYHIRCALLPRKATLKSAISMLTWTKRQQSLAARIPLSSFRHQFLHHTCRSIMIRLRATFSREAIICKPSY